MRTVLATIVALTAFALVTGFAASLTVNGQSLASGTTTIAACDPDEIVDLGFAIDPAVSVTAVDSVELSNIDTACDGADFVLDLGGTVVSGALTVTSAGTPAQGTASIDVSGFAVAADSVTSAALTITG